MRRILFLPLNRNLGPILIRSFLRGNLVYWERKEIEAHLGHISDIWINDFFKEKKWLRVRQINGFSKWYYYWVNYIKKHKINYVVTDVEASLPVLAAMHAAKKLRAYRVYIQHGEGEIYYVQDNLEFYQSGIYNYYVARNAFTASYISPEQNIDKVLTRIFRRKPFPKLPDKNAEFPKKRTYLYAPMYNWPVDHYKDWDYAGPRLSNDERLKNSLKIVDALSKYHKILYCHNPEIDTEKHPETYKQLFKRHNAGTIDWYRGRAVDQFYKADMILTDYGSGVLMNGVWAGKPTLCIHPTQSSKTKEATYLLDPCIKWWDGSFVTLEKILTDLLIKPSKPSDFVPYDYFAFERGYQAKGLPWERGNE